MTSRDLGKFGENVACGYLRQNGYDIVLRNYRSRYGEIDIIAKKSKRVVFVEVKCRDKNYMVKPYEHVTKAKQRKLILTAQLYLAYNEIEMVSRFDVISIICDSRRSKVLEIEHIEDAFDMEGFDELF